VVQVEILSDANTEQRKDGFAGVREEVDGFRRPLSIVFFDVNDVTPFELWAIPTTDRPVDIVQAVATLRERLTVENSRSSGLRPHSSRRRRPGFGHFRLFPKSKSEILGESEPYGRRTTAAIRKTALRENDFPAV